MIIYKSRKCMAEFCLDCLRKIENKNIRRWQVRLSKELDICEGCGQYKRVVDRY